MFRPIVVRHENAIDVEVVVQKDLPKAVESGAAPDATPGGASFGALQPSDAGRGKPTEPPIDKPGEIGGVGGGPRRYCLTLRFPTPNMHA